MQSVRRRGLTLGVVLLLLPAAARAEREFEITPSAGVFFGGSFQDSATGRNVGADASASFGLILGLRESPRAHYELLYRFQRTDLSWSVTPAGSPRPGVDIHYLQIGSSYEFPGKRFRPFVAAGVGLTALVPDGAGQDSSTNFSLSLGGGVKIPFSDRAGLRLEGRGYLTVLPSNSQIFCVSSGGASCDVSVEGDTLGQFELMAGVYFEI